MELTRSRGWRLQVTCDEIGSAIPAITPFQSYGSAAASLPELQAEGKLPVDTIIALTEPVDWGRDLQIIYDCITGGGHPCR